MNLFIENLINSDWYLIACYAICTVCVIYIINRNVFKPSDKQVAKIEQWLLWAVTDAERFLGSGTGQLKLSFVYGSFVKAFPWISRIVTVTMFSELVGKALVKMRDMLNKNAKAAIIVAGGIPQ
jgi:hypothetical protein